ncbi:MAG TPA: hypothetical protein VEB69_09640 [Acidimicrobiia bacterium]|nr:hypothetical protein [Acidimicrobiia bacterium]
MDTFITSTVIMTAVAGGLATPVFVVAWKRRRPDTIRSFAVGAFVIGALCGVIAYVSDVQVTQCRDAGAGECVDWGAAGMQFTLVLVFELFAWAIATAVWKD